jgi:N-acetylglucosamine kinase-like BadF-type ATPase
MPAMPAIPTEPPLAIGLDAGGTATRWACADASGVRREGQAAGLSGLQLASAEGRARVESVLVEIAAAAGPARALVAGFTGLGEEQSLQLGWMLARSFDIAPGAVLAMSDIDLACRAAFAPGTGYVVYAGTGSVAAFVDAAGMLHRAGGRGVVIDDAGGGHWIARQALQHIWRAEDVMPGAWQASPLARRLFERIGGADWAQSRQWVYGAGGGASRGDLGMLALAVAAAAAEDPAARELLHAAGTELARLARALIGRYGPRPLALAGRVFDLHPAVEQALRAALPAGTAVQRATQPAHHAAARMAAARIPR